MKYVKFALFLLSVLAAGFMLSYEASPEKPATFSADRKTEGISSEETAIPEDQKNENQRISSSNEKNISFSSPLDRAEERVTKKPFGIFITPETSPVQPDKFTGFHTGVDFEIFSDELKRDVLVRAVCSGPLKMKKTASGYGGVAVQGCEFSGEPITVVYGHLKLTSVPADAGKKLQAGEILGLLGDDKSVETDGARKHLHLSLHKGGNIDLKGYVDSARNLSAWLDPCSLGLCR